MRITQNYPIKIIVNSLTFIFFFLRCPSHQSRTKVTDNLCNFACYYDVSLSALCLLTSKRWWLFFCRALDATSDFHKHLATFGGDGGDVFNMRRSAFYVDGHKWYWSNVSLVRVGGNIVRYDFERKREKHENAMDGKYAVFTDSRLPTSKLNWPPFYITYAL